MKKLPTAPEVLMKSLREVFFMVIQFFFKYMLSA